MGQPNAPDRTARVREAMEGLRLWLANNQPAQMLRQGRWEWYTQEFLRDLHRLRERIGIVITLIDDLHPEANDEQLLELETELRFVQALTGVMIEAYERHPELMDYAKRIDDLISPPQLVERIKEDAVLAQPHTPQPPKQKTLSRRSFLGKLGLVGATAAAAALTPDIVRSFLDEGKEAQLATLANAAKVNDEWMVRPGYYVQFIASREEAACAEYLSRNKQVPLGVFLAKGNAGDNYPYKIIVKKRCASFVDAAELLAEYEQRYELPEAVGIIEVKDSDRSIWLKTIEYQVLSKRDELEHSAVPETQRPFTKEITAALNAHPLPYISPQRASSLVRAIIEVESSNKPRARSPKGAMGLMQLMPGTWKERHEQKNKRYHPRLFSGAKGEKHVCDVDDPMQNIDAGVNYLASLYETYFERVGRDETLILQMYNNGPRNVLERLERKGRTNKETREYVPKIMLAQKHT